MPTTERRRGAAGSVGPGVRHDDFFAERPADPEAKVRTGAEAAVFFLEHLA